MVKVEELEARVLELKSEIDKVHSNCKTEAIVIAQNQGWDEDFSTAFEKFYFEKKYKTQLAEKENEYNILSKYVIQENL